MDESEKRIKLLENHLDILSNLIENIQNNYIGFGGNIDNLIKESNKEIDEIYKNSTK